MPPPDHALARDATSPELRRLAAGGWCFHNRRLVHVFAYGSALVVGGADDAALPAGVLLLGAMLALRLLAVRRIGGAARVHLRKALCWKPLVTDGIYARLRHPLYLANILGLTGACLLTGPPGAAAAAALAGALWYGLIARWEERVQRRLHGEDWAVWAAAVPGWWPRLRASAGRPLPAAAPHPWRVVLRRERGAFVATLLVALLALLRAQFPPLLG